MKSKGIYWTTEYANEASNIACISCEGISKKVLILEDEDTIANLLEMIVETIGFEPFRTDQHKELCPKTKTEQGARKAE